MTDTTDLAAFAEAVRRDTHQVVDIGGLGWALTQPGLVRRDGVWIEFGVDQGGTMHHILAPERGNAELWGFDSCRGLPEDWKDDHPKGKFAMARPPLPPDGCNLVVGWFKDTLPSYAPSKPVTFAYVDCDLYSSAVTIFEWIGRSHARMPPGAVIVFDDFLSKPYNNGVMRAFLESVLKDRVELLALPRGSDVVVGKVIS